MEEVSMKRFSVLGMVAALAIAACSGGGTPPTPRPQSPAPGASGGSPGTSPGTAAGEITYLVGIAEDPEVDAKQAEMVEDFNATHPDIKVTREALDNDQLRTIIQTRLGSGDVDVFGYDTGPGFGGVLAKAGLLADMGPAYEQYGWETFDWAKSRCTYSGVLSCLPGQVEEVGIFYNKTMFDEKGFSEPTTLEEFTQIMDAFKADGVTPLAFGNQPQWPAGHQYSMTLSNIVGRDGLDARLYGEAPWNDADGVKAIDIYFRQFQDAGYFPRDPNAVTYEDANALFYSGRAAMVPTGTWLVAEITDNTDFEVGFFPFPSIEGSSISPPAGLGGGTFVAANSDSKEAAFAFLDWLVSEETVNKWLLPVFNQIPAQPVDASGADVSPLFQIVLEDLAESSGEDAEFGYNIDVLTPAGFNEQMFTGFQEVLNGALSPQQQADRLQEEYQKALEAGDTVPKP
jgi:raffinose/stachyose/melibiose transport system substrate-binding protein